MASMRPIFYLGPPCEVVFDEAFWKEMRSVGAEGICFTRLSLLDHSEDPAKLFPPNSGKARPIVLKAVGGKPVPMTPVPAFAPDLALYDGLPIPPPEMPARLAGTSARLKEAVTKAARFGLTVHFNDDKGFFMKFPTQRLNLESRHLCDPDVVRLLVARAIDTTTNFPELSAIYLDGVNYKWEIKPGHLDDIWAEVLDDDVSRRFASEHAISMQRVLDGRERFRARLHHLSPTDVEDFLANRTGALGALEWWMEEPDTIEWLRFKAAVIEWHVSAAYEGVKRHRPGLRFGVMWRMPAITALTGFLPRRIRAYCDFQMPKEYWWAGGFAGQKGTVINWVDTLVEWNPGLSPEQAMSWYCAVFGYAATPGYPVSRFHEEAPEAWFETAVADQTRKMISACGGVDRTVPVVALEHTGTTLSANELRGILRVMQRQGIRRYVWATWNYVSDECLSVMAEFARAG